MFRTEEIGKKLAVNFVRHGINDQIFEFTKKDTAQKLDESSSQQEDESDSSLSHHSEEQLRSLVPERQKILEKLKELKDSKMDTLQRHEELQKLFRATEQKFQRSKPV
jgi:hypothetical protein